MTILYILIGLIIGSLLVYFLLRPKIQITQQKNVQILEENHQLELQNQKIKEQGKELLNQYQVAQATFNDIQTKVKDSKETYNILISNTNEVKNNLLNLKAIQEKAANDYYSQALNIAENSFQNEIDKISDTLFENREQAKEIYLKTIEESVQEFQQAIQEKEQQLKEINEELQKQKDNVDLAVAAAQRRMEMEIQQNFYRVCLSDDDICEINKLREVLPFLRDKTPLNKVIYKVYYEKPLTDMIGRVIGPGIHTGIYKITNLNNDMCYIGQSTDLASRWKQHVKRGVGAEDWTQNKLYPAMYAHGIENFTFEVIEECSREQLNDREKYWTNFFHAQDFGYSIRSG